MNDQTYIKRFLFTLEVISKTLLIPKHETRAYVESVPPKLFDKSIRFYVKSFPQLFEEYYNKKIIGTGIITMHNMSWSPIEEWTLNNFEITDIKEEHFVAKYSDATLISLKEQTCLRQ